MTKIIENIGILFSSVLNTSTKVFSQETLYDKEFINQFNDKDDLEALEEAISKHKENGGNNTPIEIILKNKEVVTILVS